MNCDHIIEHIEDVVYRGHEIVICRCPSCKNFIVDARCDNYDGEFLAGYTDKSIYWAITEAQRSIDKHELDKALLVDIPF